MTGSGENQSRTSHNYWRHIFSSSQVANHSSNQENCFCCARKQTTPLDMTSVLPAGASRNVWQSSDWSLNKVLSFIGQNKAITFLRKRKNSVLD